jgi:hypothetical protein
MSSRSNLPFFVAVSKSSSLSRWKRAFFVVFPSGCDGAARFLEFLGCNIIDSPSTFGDNDRNELFLKGDLDREALRFVRGHRYVERVLLTRAKRGMFASDSARSSTLSVQAYRVVEDWMCSD